MVKAVLFDCDGTLVDSEGAHYLGWKKALIELGHDLTPDDYTPLVGKSAETNAQLLAKKAGQTDIDFILKVKREHYKFLLERGMPAIEPTVNFLKQLAEKKEQLGLKIGVCSAAKKREILTHLRHLGIDHLLDIILSGQEDLDEYSDPDGVNKPKPYIYLHAMKLLGLSPADCVVIEDSAPGVTASILAGCLTIAIPNHYTRLHDLSHAHLRLESFSGIDIPRFFEIVAKEQGAMMNLTIKPFQTKYQPGVVSLIVHIQEGEFNLPVNQDQHVELKNIPATFQQGNGNYWIALDHERVIGTMGFFDLGQSLLQLRDVFVHEDYRGEQKGVSKKLLNTLLTWAKERKIQTIYLGTTALFLAAHRFYEKNGFIEIAKNRLPPQMSCHPADTKFYRYDLVSAHAKQ
jgi:beta-phosphoglucomutase-like phosphatase (HAD superfamily)/N-acetylglutamate synthase-like GNAT family acetyltransferase